MRLFLIILAAGESKRLKYKIPKPFQRINERTLLEFSIDSFKDFNQIKKIIVVYNRKHKNYIKNLKLKNILKIIGGKTRQESTFIALKKIKNMGCEKVLIHDAARPMPSKNLIKKLIHLSKKNHAVIPTIKVNDATKRVEENIIFKNIQRESLRFSQTPQVFTFNKIYQKHKENINNFFDDDSSLLVESGEKVLSIDGEKTNIKITEKEDINI